MNAEELSITGLFSTPLASINLQNIDNYLLDYVRELPFEFVQNKNCEYSIDKRLHKHPIFFNTFDRIRKLCYVYAIEILGLDLSSSDFILDVKTSWAIKMNPGNYADSHYHSHSIFSGVFYLNVDENCSNKLRLYRPQNITKVMDIETVKWNVHNCFEYSVIPKPNDLYLFPSDIRHSADINESNFTLYSIVFDVSVKGTLCKGRPSEITLS